MTVLLPAWLQTGAYTAEHDRFVGTALLNPGTSLTGRGGVRLVAGTEFQVVPSSPASMTVTVSPGMAFVQGGNGAVQGVYTVVNDAPFNVSITPASTTNSRIDLVVLEVLDAQYSGSSNLAQVRVLTGTPGTSPQPPGAGGSFVALAQILVPTNATAVSLSNITDLRPFSTALGAPIPVRSIAERNAMPNKYDGLRVFVMDKAWEVHTYYNSEWYGSDIRFFGVTNFIIPPEFSDYSARTIVDRAKVPDPGFRYTLQVNSHFEIYGARFNGRVYCEDTTTTSVANLVAYGQTNSWGTMVHPSGVGGFPYDRLRIDGYFPQTYTGSRWVTMQVAKEPGEPANTVAQFRNWMSTFQLIMHPIRRENFVPSISTGGQP